jgi:ribosomal protein S26
MTTDDDRMVECEVCGKKVPLSKALKQGKKFFCSYGCIVRWIEE